MANEQARQLAALAARAEGHPALLASALAVYRRLAGLDAAALAAELRCDVDGIARLALCRRPREDGEMFRDDVRRIAAYAGCDPIALAGVLRETALTERAARTHAARPTLLAAHDRHG